jgi:uncharacterized protein (DUF427 family)
MGDYIQITPVKGIVTIRANGAVIGETSHALELREGRFDPVLYVPRADMAMALLDRSDRKSTCPHKGVASYFSVVTPEVTLRDAVWSYEEPLPGVEAISGHLAFYTDKVTVERR